MKPLALAVVVVVLFGAGIGGAWWYLNQQGSSQGTGGSAADPRAGQGGRTEAHGTPIEIPENAALCATHNIPAVVCPFCDPTLIESRGHCGSHDVAEALCTRCSPILIGAFKIEKDWCAEHELPESQCLICNPKSDG